METLPDELVLNILSFCGAEEVCRFSRTSKRYFDIGSDQLLWAELCMKQGYPRRKKCTGWKEWFLRMKQRKTVRYRFDTDKEKRKVLVEKDDTIKEFISKVSAEHHMPPYCVDVYGFKKNVKLLSTPAFEGGVLKLSW